jgi:magnesium transporter
LRIKRDILTKSYVSLRKLSTKGTKKQKHNVGADSGEMFKPTDVPSEAVKITLIQYNPEEYYEDIYYDVQECKKGFKPGTMRWINVDGIHNLPIIENFGKVFSIHPLTLEDITHIDSRPKFEEYSRYVVSIFKMLYFDGIVCSEHLSILLFEDTVISFQELRGGDAFDPVRNRLRESKGRIRKMGADYMAYALTDAVIDQYFVVLEKLGEKIEHLDDEVLYNPNQQIMLQLHDLKKETQQVKKMMGPVREMVFNMMRSETDLISETNTIYLRDVHDHIQKVNDTVEQYRDSLAGIMDVYLSNNTNKMNEVMKTLTTISAIFIPVTFIAGIYGMNFNDQMPEFQWKYSGYVVYGLMAVMMVGMAVYFKHKKWW